MDVINTNYAINYQRPMDKMVDSAKDKITVATKKDKTKITSTKIS